MLQDAAKLVNLLCFNILEYSAIINSTFSLDLSVLSLLIIVIQQRHSFFIFLHASTAVASQGAILCTANVAGRLIGEPVHLMFQSELVLRWCQEHGDSSAAGLTALFAALDVSKMLSLPIRHKPGSALCFGTGAAQSRMRRSSAMSLGASIP